MRRERAVTRNVTPGVVRWWSEMANGRVEPGRVSTAAWGALVMLSVPYGIAGAIVQWSRARHPVRLDVPVVSVGNLVVGGTGKTPLTIFLARRLSALGRSVAIVSRGYGRLSRSVVVVSEGQRPLVGWEEAGDEPVLEAMVTRGVIVVVGADRVRAARYAVDKLGADVILVDDGFQHVRLARDLDVVTVDARSPVGNGHLLPGGTLRESPLGIGRADLLVVTRCGETGDAGRVETTLGPLAPDAPMVTTRMRPAELWDVGTGEAVRLSDVRSRRCLALSSIAAPSGLDETLAHMGLEVASALAFPDHHRYSERDHALVVEEARSSCAEVIVTTEKDAVRLAAWRPPLPLVALGIEIEVLEGSEFLDRALMRLISSGGSNGASGLRPTDR